MNTTMNIASRLTFIANNIQNSAYKRVCIEAADRLGILYGALGELIDDSQHAGHNCGDEGCPIIKAQKAYYMGIEY